MNNIIHIQTWLMYGCIGILLLIAAVMFLVKVCAPVWDALRQFANLPRIQQIVLGIVICGFIQYGATKSSISFDGGIKQNGVLAVENAILVETNAVLEVDAKKAQKVEKAAAKAAKKDQKNFEKWIKDTEKAKSKSSEDMAEFYDSVLELAGESN